MYALELVGINKIYGKATHAQVRALDNVSLCVRQGDMTALVGPSGSGKSTLLKILACIDVPDSGEYRLLGKEVAGLNDVQRARLRCCHIGIVPQQFGLIPYRSALENVSLPLLISGQRADVKKRCRDALEAVGMGKYVDRKTEELSGGEQQRVAIARAIIARPDVILADERTGNLDRGNSKAIMELLVTLNEQGHTILIATHDDFVADICGRCLNIIDGHIT